MEYLSSIVFHNVILTYCLATRTVLNIVDDKYSSFALLSDVATFLGFACFYIFSSTRTVWNTIDDKYSSFVLHMEYLSSIVFHTVLLTYFLATRTVWNTIDDKYSTFALLSDVATFLGFACFDIFSSTSSVANPNIEALLKWNRQMGLAL